MLFAFDGGARVHDLPPRWDGRVVEWSPWQRYRVFVCGRGVTDPRCSGCDSNAVRAASRGTVHPLAGETAEVKQPRVKRTRSGREYVSGTVALTMPVKPHVGLVVFRCSGCDTDEVVDARSGECWTLDGSDYGPDGSTS